MVEELSNLNKNFNLGSILLLKSTKKLIKKDKYINRTIID